MRRAEEMRSADMSWEMLLIHLPTLITRPLNTQPRLLTDLHVGLDYDLALSLFTWFRCFPTLTLLSLSLLFCPFCPSWWSKLVFLCLSCWVQGEGAICIFPPQLVKKKNLGWSLKLPVLSMFTEWHQINMHLKNNLEFTVLAFSQLIYRSRSIYNIYHINHSFGEIIMNVRVTTIVSLLLVLLLTVHCYCRGSISVQNVAWMFTKRQAFKQAFHIHTSSGPRRRAVLLQALNDHFQGSTNAALLFVLKCLKCYDSPFPLSTDTPSRLCSVHAVRKTCWWVWIKEWACVSSTCLRWRCSTEGRSVATDM